MVVGPFAWSNDVILRRTSHSAGNKPQIKPISWRPAFGWKWFAASRQFVFLSSLRFTGKEELNKNILTRCQAVTWRRHLSTIAANKNPIFGMMHHGKCRKHREDPLWQTLRRGKTFLVWRIKNKRRGQKQAYLLTTIPVSNAPLSVPNCISFHLPSTPRSHAVTVGRR